MIEAYRETFRLRSPLAHVLELGFFHGASTVFFDRLLQPIKLVAIDRVTDAPWLEHYRARHPSGIVPYYGVAQQDRAALTEILLREFPTRTLDLVIDDASHEYEPTRTAFETVWPFVSPGGLYVIEDWAWAHWPGPWQALNPPPIPGPALSNLVLELLLMHASAPEIVSGLQISDPDRVTIIRGPAALEPGTFALDTALRLRADRCFTRIEDWRTS